MRITLSEEIQPHVCLLKGNEKILPGFLYRVVKAGLKEGETINNDIASTDVTFAI